MAERGYSVLMAATDPVPLAVSYDTAARMLECSPDTIRDLIAAGELHVVRIKSLARIRVSELTAFLEAGGTARGKGCYPTTPDQGPTRFGPEQVPA